MADRGGGEEERCQREAKVAKPGGVKKGGMKEAQRWSWGLELLDLTH